MKTRKNTKKTKKTRKQHKQKQTRRKNTKKTKKATRKNMKKHETKTRNKKTIQRHWKRETYVLNCPCREKESEWWWMEAVYFDFVYVWVYFQHQSDIGWELFIYFYLCLSRIFSQQESEWWMGEVSYIE